MNRGAQKQRIFKDERDYLSFLSLLDESAKMWKIEIHAYCLMPNHYHLLIRTPLPNLSRSMRHINGVYTQRYNLRWRRDAQLFRGRYKAILVEEEGYLDELVRYICLNPAASELTDSPEKYRWSSYQYYLGAKNPPQCLSINFVLSQHGKRLNKARRNLVKFISAGVPEKLCKTLDGNRWPSVLGSELFSDWVENTHIKLKRDPEIVSDIPQVEVLPLKQIIKIISDIAGIPWPLIKAANDREGKFWRDASIVAMRQAIGLTYNKISRAIGGIHPAQISRLMHNKYNALASDQRWLHLNAELENAKVKT